MLNTSLSRLTQGLSLAVVGAGLGLSLGSIPAAQAAGLVWDYTLDSFNDGTEGNIIGANSIFELYGAAVGQDKDSLWFAINGNLPYGGDPDSGSQGGTIAYGDLFLNFSGKNFAAAQASGDVIGIRFIEGNDSGAPALGVYGGVKAKSVTSTNSGYSNLTKYRNKVTNLGGTASLGDLGINDSYLDASKSLNVIDTYTTLLSQNPGDLLIFQDASGFAGTDLDFGSVGATGSQTFGFKVAKDALPASAEGNFIAHFFAECINDGMALFGVVDRSQSVPEPTGIVTWAIVGIAGMLQLRRRAA
jgi:hypothetical protein